ncbi:hypothetical protein [Streptosporangium sp. NPDC002524]|uniref:hypothetical protein n=1 Tax=Streptosporangium sp. NPDC002524 TaxID=3154537 RepID=UPI003317FFA1
MSTVSRPHIVVDPAVNDGRPTLPGGASVADVIAAYIGGATPATLYLQYRIGREDLLICCWWVARYAKQRQTWKNWLDRWGPMLATRELAEVPLPVPGSRSPVTGPAHAPRTDAPR